MFQQKILRFKEIKELTSLSRTTIWRLENEGNFPKRRLIGPHSVGWLLSEIMGWMNSRSLEKCPTKK
jgi:prophage regulatory protein